MEGEEVIKKHLGKAIEFELENKDGETDKILLSPLSVNDLPELYSTLKLIDGADEDNPTSVMQNMTPEAVEQIAELGVKSLRKNYPNTSNEELKMFVMRNAFRFVTEMWALNMNFGSDREIGEVKRRQAVKRIQDANKQRQKSD